MGNYYCDYCDKRMKDSVSQRRLHLDSLAHQKAQREHYQKFKDIRTILQEESTKRPCTRMDQCKFGIMCRFSHYRAEQILQMQQQVAKEDYDYIMANTLRPIDEFIIDQHFQDLQLDRRVVHSEPAIDEAEANRILAKWEAGMSSAVSST